MDLEQIRELISLMKENDLTEVRIVEGDKRWLLKRGKEPEAPVVAVAPTPVPAAQPVPTPPATPATPKPAEAEPTAAINSPMVGTFYTTPTPDAAPYVRVGDHVDADTIVCIIEAMKVMNEIKADVAGTIEKVLVKNTEPVEFGQPLFQIRPD